MTSVLTRLAPFTCPSHLYGVSADCQNFEVNWHCYAKLQHTTFSRNWRECQNIFSADLTLVYILGWTYVTIFFKISSPFVFPAHKFFCDFQTIRQMVFLVFYNPYCVMGSTRWCSLLRHGATSRKVSGSIPDGVTGIFHRHNPSGCAMSMKST